MEDDLPFSERYLTDEERLEQERRNQEILAKYEEMLEQGVRF